MIFTKKWHKRLFKICILGLFVSGIICLALFMLRKNIFFFIKPSEITQKHIGEKLRIGGLVENVKQVGLDWFFDLKDANYTMNVRFRGLPPELFKSDIMVVVEGVLQTKKYFQADKIMTKHDEKYRPKELQ